MVIHEYAKLGLMSWIYFYCFQNIVAVAQFIWIYLNVAYMCAYVFIFTGVIGKFLMWSSLIWVKFS